jgi:DNA replication protein DnaC
VGVGKTSYFYFRNWFALHVVLAVEDGNIVVNLKKAIDASSQISVIIIRSCQDITESFLKAKDEDDAHFTLKNLKTNVSSEYIFDDLGVENTNLSRYGNVYNLMADVLTSRYELYERHQTKTHLTSNLITEQIGNMYGARITDRLRSMCNLIFFPQNSESKRV